MSQFSQSIKPKTIVETVWKKIINAPNTVTDQSFIEQ